LTWQPWKTNIEVLSKYSFTGKSWKNKQGKIMPISKYGLRYRSILFLLN
jgi:hypothetical protein